ncbi:hypothetical protein [Pseudovibrio sp. Ad26]|uniref:hypothetical protein n=1 Tax=Pseudovibrio sp. Ad26 TaxID=989410 RepID=UPI0007AE680E|nr:hypothetical protein [Pseudovibrio sp. Ad26]KZL10712.1 hypothetical protein PsAD26_03077 [Pseudovibrio sp. Ad26]
MSLVRIAARHCLCEALKGKTSVGDNVQDSAFGALNFNEDGLPETSQDQPFLTVYTDEADMQASGNSLELLSQADTKIYFEWGITSSMSVKDDETGEAVIVQDIPVTDANMEFKLDLIGREILNALSDTRDPYVKMFRELLMGVTSFKKGRIANEQDGLRLAAHQFELKCMLLEEPRTGAEVLSNPFGELFELMEGSGDPSIAAKADLMRTALEPEAPPLDVFRMENGMHPDQIETLGLDEAVQDG